MIRKKLIFICLSISLILIPHSMYAFMLPTSPPVPVGSGARAQGMAGAFIAVADDATAASWNPGGLGQLQKPELSIVGSYRYRNEDYTEGVISSGACDTSTLDLNYLSAAYAKKIWERNVFFSLNYQKLFDYDRTYSLTRRFSNSLYKVEQIDFRQDGSLYALSPALAIELKEGLYAGLVYNLWSDHITGHSQWEGEITNTLFNTLNETTESILISDFKVKSFKGENWTLGFLWKITQQFHVGGVYKSHFKAMGKYEGVDMGMNPMNPVNPLYQDESYSNFWIDFPAAYGLGFSYRFGDSFTVSADITRTEWKEYVLSDENQEFGPFPRPVFDENNVPIPNAYYVPEKESTYSLRLGFEYTKILKSLIIPFRWGVFYDPEPSVNAPQDYYGISCGLGMVINQRIALDLAYQYRFGNTLDGNELSIDFGESITKGKIKQHLGLVSVILYF